MQFVAEKDPGMIPGVLSDILDNCVNGVTLSDPDLPDNPIVYANEVFERMTGYYAAAPTADFDRDGRIDIFEASWFEHLPNRLFRNVTDIPGALAEQVQQRAGRMRLPLRMPFMSAIRSSIEADSGYFLRWRASSAPGLDWRGIRC